MVKKLLIFGFAFLYLSTAKAQVEGVSVIVSPTAGYNWFDNKSTVEDGFMYGFQAGFGFGNVVELRGIYMHSANLQQNFGQYEEDIQDIIPGFEFDNRNITFTRIGGEFKTNIPAKGFAPYILLGTGVQKFLREEEGKDDYTNENLYVSAGLGVKINMGDRTTLNFEGRGIAYNMNPNSLLYNEGGSSEFDDWINSQKPGRMYNWSVQAALQFYLGGRNDENLTPVEKAFLNRFSGGLSQSKLTLAPAGAYIDFNSNSGFRDSYMLGGILGFDFTHFVGLRAYYYQATGDEPSFDFDNLGMYGLDFIGSLNVARGIVPYITVGGGYLNVQDDYRGKNIGTPTDPFYQETHSGYYAKGGVGLTLPLGKYVDVYGAANLFYTMDNQDVDVGDLKSADQLMQHTLYNVGIRLKLGSSAQTQSAMQEEFIDRFSDERYAYEQRIRSLEERLQKAVEKNDTEEVVRIMEEKKKMEEEKEKVETRQAPADTLIRMTPAQLESLVETTIKGIENESHLNSIENKLDRLEQLLLYMNSNRMAPDVQRRFYDDQNYDPYRVPQQKKETVDPQQDNGAMNESNNVLEQRLIQEIIQLKQELQRQNTRIDALQRQPEMMNDEIMNDEGNNDERNTDSLLRNPDPNPEMNNRVPDQNTGGNRMQNDVPENQELSVFVGPSFGEVTTFNIGARLNRPIGNTAFIFMPEAYVALGNASGFGISANAIYTFNIKEPRFTPYAGLGIGLNILGGETYFNPNIIVGTAYAWKKGNLFADLTVRGAFNNNQLALGYRFKL